MARVFVGDSYDYVTKKLKDLDVKKASGPAPALFPKVNKTKSTSARAPKGKTKP